MAEPLNKEEEDLLQSALESAFQPAELPRVEIAPMSPVSPHPQSSTEPEPPSDSNPSSSSEAAEKDEQWKREYEAQVSEWRQKSAEQREKAEKERKRWEGIRKAEREHALVEGKDKEEVKDWESINVSIGPSRALSETDSRSIASSKKVPPPGEPLATEAIPEDITPLSTTSSPRETAGDEHGRAASGTGSGEKWEHVPSSVTSPYPSVSYPSDPHSPVSSRHHQDLPLHHEHHRHGHKHVDRAPPPATATSAIFDTSLSTKTRTLALLSSLAINLLLPFVNGVMLGFGEIFARNVAFRWFGWGAPERPPRTGRVATSVGVNASTNERKKYPWMS